MGNNQPQPCSVCNKISKLQQCRSCKKGICQDCHDYPVLNNFQGDIMPKKLEYVATCKQCFLSKTQLDFTKKYEIIGDQNQKQILFIHGAGSCRKMFLPHARDLANYGYRCILMDLPRHGSRLDEPLNLQSCLQAIKQTIKQACKYKDLTIVGGSLGGYVLMLVLGIQPSLCSRAVVMMSGQNVGVNRGKMASIGLFFMNKSTELLSQVTMVNTFMNSATGNKHINRQYLKQFVKSGSYFKYAKQNIILLKNSDYQQSLKNNNKQVKFLFINGEKDFRDSQQIWLNAAGAQSKLIVYEKVDHFFSHDNRSYQRLIQDIKSFIEA